MPLSSQLSLDVSPHSAAGARQWVGTVLTQLGREDLVECAELGASELVTNAVLHGSPPLKLQVRGTADHPRIEVHDGSVDAPSPPEPVSPDDDEFLVTFGRGLAIVARCAVACGATIEAEGKVVWFEPAAEMHEDRMAGWTIDSHIHEAAEPTGDTAVPVTLKGVDLALYESLSQQYRELRRELRLLSLGHLDTYPLAANLTAIFANFERQFPTAFESQVGAALRQGRKTLDVSVRMLPEARSIFVTMSEMFELADAFCRAQRLLAIERTPEQREFHSWLLGELVRQLAGEPPRPWLKAPASRAGQGRGDVRNRTRTAGRSSSSQVS